MEMFVAKRMHGAISCNYLRAQFLSKIHERTLLIHQSNGIERLNLITFCHLKQVNSIVRDKPKDGKIISEYF